MWFLFILKFDLSLKNEKKLTCRFGCDLIIWSWKVLSLSLRSQKKPIDYKNGKTLSFKQIFYLIMSYKSMP